MNNRTIKSFSLSFLDRAFPPPMFLRMPAAGIDISDTTVRFIDFGMKKGAKFIKSYGQESIPPGVMSAGFINNPDAVIKILSKIREENGIVFANVSLPEEKAYLFKMQVPKLPHKELFDAIGYRLEENVPISPAEAIYDFTILPTDKKDTDHFDVMVSVIPSKVSEIYAHVFKAAGITPLTFEISSQAIGRAVVSPESSYSYLIMNLGDTKTGLAIVNKGIVFFSSTVQVGSAALDKIAATVFNVPISDIPDIKADVIASGKQDMSSFLKIMDATGPIKEEIIKLSAYWKTHSVGILHKPADIDKIILCGRDSAIPSFDEYFATATGIRVEIANVWQNIFAFEDYIPQISYKESLDYAGAIGLAMLS